MKGEEVNYNFSYGGRVQVSKRHFEWMGELTIQISRRVFCTQGTDNILVHYGRDVPGAIKRKQKTDEARTQQSKKKKGIHCTQVQPENNIQNEGKI